MARIAKDVQFCIQASKNRLGHLTLKMICYE